MSDINLDFTVSNNNIDFTVVPNDITITPTDIQLTFYTGAPPVAATALDADISNVHIYGGIDGYVLQTDGTGNLTWTAQTGGGGGNGSPGGANTQIQYNDAGSFGGNAGFTFNKTSGNVSMPSNLIVTGNINGNIGTAVQPYITSLGTLSSITVGGLTSIQEAAEKVTLNSSPATGTVNFDVLTQAILFNTANATGNFVLGIRGNSSVPFNNVINVGQSMTIRFINTNGNIGYYANAITIDSTPVAPLWVYPSGAPSIGVTNGKDTYDFNIIKTAGNVYNILASRTGYK